MYPFAPNSISYRKKPHDKSIIINIDLPRFNHLVIDSDKLRVICIDFFIAIPLSIAVAIGKWLN